MTAAAEGATDAKAAKVRAPAPHTRGHRERAHARCDLETSVSYEKERGRL